MRLSRVFRAGTYHSASRRAVALQSVLSVLDRVLQDCIYHRGDIGVISQAGVIISCAALRYFSAALFDGYLTGPGFRAS